VGIGGNVYDEEVSDVLHKDILAGGVIGGLILIILQNIFNF